MENEVLDALEDLNYEGEIKDEKSLLKAVQGVHGGSHNLAYIELIVWLTGELRLLCNFEEEISKISDVDDHASFLLEVSAFIKEMNCPHKSLMQGSVSERLSNQEQRVLLLRYLAGELHAARMISSTKSSHGMKVEMKETDHAKDLKALLIALMFSKPPNNISAKMLFQKVHEKVSDILTKADPSLVGSPLYDRPTTDKQWHFVAEMQQEMQNEYRMRREMLIKRLDVTIQSFQWSDQAKAKENDLTRAFRVRRDAMQEEPSVSLGMLLAARADLAILEKTSNASVRKNTQTKLNKVIIGKVPDRGGRAYEHEPPPPEMPSWTQRSSQVQGFSGGRGGRGGGQWSSRGSSGFSSDRGGSSGFSSDRGGSSGFSSDRGGSSGFSSDRVQGGWNKEQRGRGGYGNRGGYSNGDSRQDGQRYRGGRGRGRY